MVLSAYFQPHESADIQTAQLAWWADELQDWTREQVVWALRKWNRDEPRRRPTPGDILRLLKSKRGEVEAAKKISQVSPTAFEKEYGCATPFELSDEQLAERRAQAQRIMAEVSESKRVSK